MVVNGALALFLILLHCGWVATTDDAAGQTSNTDVRVALIEKEIGNISSVLTQVLTQVQAIETKQNAMEFTLATEIKNVKSNDEKLIKGLTTRMATTDKRLSQLEGNGCGCQDNLDSLNSTLTYLYDKVEKGRDCADLYKRGIKQSGVYTISPPDNLGEFDVYCDMETDGGGWTVFQRRQDGSVDFFRGWDDYKTGFSNVYSEFWLGNEKLHRLTAISNNKLRVDLEDWAGVKVYATYSAFIISNEALEYRLMLGTYSGNAGDSLSYHGGIAFSTKDRDNDESPSGDCADLFKGGWWYSDCHQSNLNGIYYKGGSYSDTKWKGIHWGGYKNERYSMKRTEMKIRPTKFKL